MKPANDPSPDRNGSRAEVVEQLRRLLPRMEGLSSTTRVLPFGLAEIDAHLPQGGLTYGALHEIVPAAGGDRTAAFGFIAAQLARTQCNRPVLLVATRKLADHGRPYGHGFHALGLDPGRVILVETGNEQQTLWAIEEALRSGAPAAVAGMIGGDFDLKTSQRLHFTAGESGLPLMLLRSAGTLGSSAAVTRWRIAAAKAGRDRFGLIARWRWRLTLERCRNGRPGEWLVEFDHAAHRFSLVSALADPALSRSADAQPLTRAGRSR